ncbi:MAG TPA: HAMP domain-containing sensor histidine kinase [Fibrobacteria bacterium]|nr:HAMP domain-containing sensor histidine kinase [Fibrobacteria bacterium]HOX50009.1 HAMP domain-containing sensor histidine kinase [Fibrobacteria bacterium]
MLNLPHGSDDTYFAPAGRAHPSRLQAQVAACLESPLAKAILDSLSGYVVILNSQRQVLAANAELEDALLLRRADSPTGRRWGEIMGCVHANDGPDLCGTSKACSCCGAALAILASSLQDGRARTECRMAMRRDGIWEGREFLVTASMVDMGAGRFQVVVFQDASERLRRETLEKMFLHDLANTVLALEGWTSVLEKGVDEHIVAGKILSISKRLSDFVNDHRLVLRAESGDLDVCARETDPREILESVAGILRSHPACRNRMVLVDAPEGGSVAADPSLLVRILLNMGLNALEAVAPGVGIRLSFAMEDRTPVFSVWNPGTIPADISHQIFHRSFSTKAKSGRGLGSHSMKILGENYLKGKVDFTTSPDEGTIFRFWLPPVP